MILSRAISQIGSRQRGVISLEQLHACDADKHLIGRLCRHGHLHRVWPHVFAIGHLALSWEARLMAAVLTGGDGALACGRSAARLWKMPTRGYHDSAPLEVLVTKYHRPLRGIKYVQSRTLSVRESRIAAGIPATSPARTFVELADQLTALQLTNVMHEADYRQRFDVRQVQHTLHRNRNRAGASTLKLALAMHLNGSAGTRSALEDRYHDLTAGVSCGPRLINVHVTAGDTSFEIDDFHPDARLCVEIDGGAHARARNIRADKDRGDQLRAAGYSVLRISQTAIECVPDEIPGVLERALAKAAQERRP